MKGYAIYVINQVILQRNVGTTKKKYELIMIRTKIEIKEKIIEKEESMLIMRKKNQILTTSLPNLMKLRDYDSDDENWNNSLSTIVLRLYRKIKKKRNL